MIWVIGEKGLVGSELVKILEENRISYVSSGHEVDVTDMEALESFLKNTETMNYLKSHKDDFTDPDAGKIKWIINCSGYTNVNKAEEEPEEAARINSKGTLNIARVARNHSAKLIHISSDYVFDGTKREPYTEKDGKNPLSVYGKTKNDGETSIIFSMRQYYIIRTSWLYGFNRNNFVYTMKKLFDSESEVKVINDQKGTPTSVQDLCNVILTFIEKTWKATGFFGKNSTPAFGIYNFSDKGETTWYNFALKIQELLKKSGKSGHECKVQPCTSIDFPCSARRPAYSVLDKSKIEKELNIRIPDWEKSLEHFIKDKRFNPL